MTLYEPLDFAVVRAPLLPVDTLDAYASGDKDLRDALSSEARAALAVASRTFSDALAKDGAGPLGPRTKSTLRRYLIRMSTRPTPLGLFAAVGLANWGERTDIELTAGQRPRRARRTRRGCWRSLTARSPTRRSAGICTSGRIPWRSRVPDEFTSPSGYLATMARRYRCRFEPPRLSSVP